MPKSIRTSHYRILSIPTVHSVKVASAAYLVENGQCRILYTGGMVRIKKDHHEELGKLDLVITDGSFIRDRGLIRRDKATGEEYGHNSIPNLVDFFGKFTNHIIFVHFGSWFYKDIQLSKERIMSLGNDTKIEASYDGMEIYI